MKIDVMGLIEFVKRENETRQKPPTPPPAREPTPESSTQNVQDFLPDAPVETDPPLAAPTDPREVSASKRKTPPSPLRMQYAYQWLCSFNMEFRFRGRCAPASKCPFLVDWLPATWRTALEDGGDLAWRDWNTLYTRLKRWMADNRDLSWEDWNAVYDRRKMKCPPEGTIEEVRE